MYKVLKEVVQEEKNGVGHENTAVWPNQTVSFKYPRQHEQLRPC